MTAKPSGKTGWTQHEQDILFEQAKKARDLGLPLKAAFDQTARLTGRQPNSIRNFYYAKIKEEGLEAPMGASAFIPFTDEEIRHLLEQVLTRLDDCQGALRLLGPFSQGLPDQGMDDGVHGP